MNDVNELPSAYVTYMKQLLGYEWLDFHTASQKTATRAVRLHRIGKKAKEHASLTREDRSVLAIAQPARPIPQTLQSELLEDVPWSPDSYYIRHDSQLGKSVYQEMGAYYLQEPSAMGVASALGVQRGERVLDLCAAPGGKATAIGHCLAGSGVFVANEIHKTRVLALAQNLERTGVPAVITNEDSARLASRWPSYFDAVLVDAPCSGEGMFRKNKDAALSWNADAPQICSRRQREILSHALLMVRPGGRIIYSTCTFNPIENEQIAAWFVHQFPVELAELPNWPGWSEGRPEWADNSPSLTSTRRLWPHVGRGEGHFIAAFRRLEAGEATDLGLHSGNRSNGRIELRGQRQNTYPFLRGKALAEWQSFLCELCGPNVPRAWLQPILHGTTLVANTQLDLPVDGLRVLRQGISLATTSGNHFTPHHQLAMMLDSDACKASVDVDVETAARYFAGEALPSSSHRGWVLVQHQGLPLGWAKSVAGRMNNAYPKGLRRTDLINTPK